MTENEQAQIFAKNLNHYVSLSGKQQKDVAIDMGIEPTTFNTWCKGRIIPPTSKLRKIADYFHIGISFLLDEGPDPRTKNLYLHLSDEAIAVAEAFDNADIYDKINVLRTLGLQKRAEDILQISANTSGNIVRENN